jgi:hypothetical protein
MHKNKKAWTLILVLGAAMKIFSEFPVAVEKYYSNGLYGYISITQRALFGWIPFSIGDCLYGLLILFLLFRTFVFFKTIFQKKANRQFWWNGIRWICFWALMVYLVFNVLWGLNYNRIGIQQQLALNLREYKTEDLDTVMRVMVQRLHQFDSGAGQERNRHTQPDSLFADATSAYESAQQQYKWLKYNRSSLKPSLFSLLGNYLGYTGYYNPFSGEAQVNVKVPLFVQPFTTCHEIGHQMGYAKENEANFAGYLSAKSSSRQSVRYSLYFDLYNYGIRELMVRDNPKAKSLHSTIPLQSKADFEELKRFNKQYQNPIEPYIRKMYAQYLMANEQPGGMQSYSEVMAFLIAYYKKYGESVL